jgi:hypothetical protein
MGNKLFSSLLLRFAFRAFVLLASLVKRKIEEEVFSDFTASMSIPTSISRGAVETTQDRKVPRRVLLFIALLFRTIYLEPQRRDAREEEK